MPHTLFQSPSSVVMVRPHYFTPNPETEDDNSFQVKANASNKQSLSASAFSEVNNAIAKLKSYGVNVHVFDDETTETPDSVFPNNWFSSHHDGSLVIYPMYCANRRLERRPHIIQYLEHNFHISRVHDYSHHESSAQYLEGTGSMVLDHVNRKAYAVKSNRMNEVLLNNFCAEHNYQAVAFDAKDKNGTSIYHTNVLMSVSTQFCMIGLDAITKASEREAVLEHLKSDGKEVITLSNEQLENFAGNTLELSTPEGKILALSKTAYDALTIEQKQLLESFVTLVPIEVPTIEMAGGSIRCMLAGIYAQDK